MSRPSTRVRFPLVQGEKSHWPAKSPCPVCRRKKVCEPHSFAALSFGALLMDRKKDLGGPSPNMDGYLGLTWHGAHDGGQGEEREVYCGLDLAREVRGGQGDLCFCSTACLRAFLNTCVDELEARIAAEGEPRRKHPRG